MSQTVAPLTYNSETQQSSSFLITVVVAVTLKARDGRVLYQNDNYVFRQQYQATTDLPTKSSTKAQLPSNAFPATSPRAAGRGCARRTLSEGRPIAGRYQRNSVSRFPPPVHFENRYS